MADPSSLSKQQLLDLIQEQTAKLAERDTQLSERDTQLFERDTQLFERDTQLAGQSQKLAQSKDIIKQLELKVDEKDRAYLHFGKNASRPRASVTSPILTS